MTTAEERAREIVGNRPHYHGCRSYDDILLRVAAALTEAHAEGRRKALEEAAQKCEALGRAAGFARVFGPLVEAYSASATAVRSVSDA
jgi:hypothetical protein